MLLKKEGVRKEHPRQYGVSWPPARRHPAGFPARWPLRRPTSASLISPPLKVSWWDWGLREKVRGSAYLQASTPPSGLPSSGNVMSPTSLCLWNNRMVSPQSFLLDLLYSGIPTTRVGILSPMLRL